MVNLQQFLKNNKRLMSTNYSDILVRKLLSLEELQKKIITIIIILQIKKLITYTLILLACYLQRI